MQMVDTKDRMHLTAENIVHKDVKNQEPTKIRAIPRVERISM